MSEPVIELTINGTGKVVAHACGTCMKVRYDEYQAKHCCMPTICACGAVCEEPWIACKECRASKEAARARAGFEKATKISWRDHDGPVYDEAADRYSESVVEFAYNRALEPDSEWPTHVWACRKEALTMDAVAIIEDALEDHHETAREWIGDEDEEELQLMLNEWCAKQGVESWYEDDTCAVMLDGIIEGMWPDGR